MKKIMICYWFENLPVSKRIQFKRKLFGSMEKTHGGKYITKIKGYLTGKKIEKPIRSMVIISENDKKGVLKILKEFGAKHKLFWVQKVEE